MLSGLRRFIYGISRLLLIHTVADGIVDQSLLSLLGIHRVGVLMVVRRNLFCHLPGALLAVLRSILRIQDYLGQLLGCHLHRTSGFLRQGHSLRQILLRKGQLRFHILRFDRGFQHIVLPLEGHLCFPRILRTPLRHILCQSLFIQGITVDLFDDFHIVIIDASVLRPNRALGIRYPLPNDLGTFLNPSGHLKRNCVVSSLPQIISGIHRRQG